MKRSILGALSLAGLIVLAGCTFSTSSAPSNDSRPRVVTTIGMITDLVRQVAVDTVQVEELMGPGVDPHIYKPRESDRQKLDQADLILYNGLHLEGNMANILERNPKAKAVSHDIPQDRLLKEADQPDPHVWFDVSLWIHALSTVEKELCQLAPQHAERYRDRAKKYREKLEALHEEVKRDIATVPKQQRVLVTAHDAFRYFGLAYDIDVKGLQGISTADEVGLKEVRELVDLIVERKIKAIFPETSVPDDGIDKVIGDCGRKGHTVQKAGEKLFSDAMDKPGSPGGTYEGMVRHNVRVIVNALK